MILLEAIDQYAVARDVREATIKSYRLAVRRFDAWLGRPSTVADLTTENINRWLYELRRGNRLSSYSVQSYRRCLLVIARYLATRGHVGRIDSADIAAVRCPPTRRDVWTPDEVRHLIASVDMLPDDMLRTRVRRRAWWRSLLLAGWDSALRWSDLSRLTIRDIAADGTVELTQWKTLVSHVVRFSPATLVAIRESFRGLGVAADRQLIWPVPYPNWRHRDLTRLLVTANLTGNLQKLRRSSITAAEVDRSGQGTLLAGHTNPATTAKWYLNRAAILEERPAPPPLLGGMMDTDGPTDGVQRRIWRHTMRRDEIATLKTPLGTIDLRVGKDDRGRPELTVLTDHLADVEIDVRRH